MRQSLAGGVADLQPLRGGKAGSREDGLPREHPGQESIGGVVQLPRCVPPRLLCTAVHAVSIMDL